MNCFYCGSLLHSKYTRLDKNILYCPNDQLFFSQPKKARSDKQVYNRDFFNAYPHSDMLDLTYKYFLNKLEIILKLTNKDKPNILDIGCGWGDFLTVCKKENIPYLGIDTSEAAYSLCTSKNLNCKKISSIMLAKQSKKKYNAIVSFQTIEHIKNPFDYLRSVKKLLKKNGVFVLTTPNNNSAARFVLKGGWSVYRPHGHYVFYNKDNLKKVLEKANFEQIDVKIDRPRFFKLGYISNQLNVDLRSNFLKNLPIPTDPMGDLIAVCRKGN